MLAIWKREVQNYFLTSIGYVFMGIFLLVGGAFFIMGNILSKSASIATVLSNLNYAFMLFVPILTMKLLSDERRSKSDQLLLTSPRSIWDIVLGKFLAASTVVIASLVLTLIYVIIIACYSNTVYPALIFSNYLGSLLLGLSYVALGVLMSALTESQVVACILTLGVNLLLQLLENYGTSVLASLYPSMGSAISWLGLYTRYNQFAAGILSIANIIYYVSFCGIVLFLTVRVIDKRRWSEG